MAWATFRDIRNKLKDKVKDSSQTALAKQLGISQPLLNQILHGERGDRAVNAKVLAGLGFDPEPYYRSKR